MNFIVKAISRKIKGPSVSIHMEVAKNHPFLILMEALCWDTLIQLSRDAREMNGKRNTGPDPSYRALLGAIIVRILHSCTLRKAMDLIQYHSPSRILCGLDTSCWTPDFRTIHDFEMSLGDGGLHPHRGWCDHADAALCPVAVYLLLHRNADWHGDVHHRQPLPGVRHGTDPD